MAQLPHPALPISDRIALRVPDERDIALIIDASHDPLIPVITTVEANSTHEQAGAFITRQQGRAGEGRGWSLTIVDRLTDTPVGNVFISAFCYQLGCVEVGYWVGPSHRGHGYAAETLGLVRDWAPEALGVDRLTLYIDPENAPSLRTAERAGFVREVEHDRWERVGDEFRPMTVWRHGATTAERSELGVLESRMWLNGYRDDARWFEHHLHRDFSEHGCSGTLWTRPKIVAQDIGPISVELPFTDLHLDQIDVDTWMLTYVAIQPDRTCRRMSLWQRTPDGWRLRFHQGTPMTRPLEVRGRAEIFEG